MELALRSLLESVIDYAGLFPPAKLDMEPALAQYLGHLSGDEQWLVDHFICPAARLPELAKAIQQSGSDQPFGVSVIGSGGSDDEEFKANLDKDRLVISDFRLSMGDGYAIDAYEVRAQIHTETALRFLKRIEDMDVYLEVPWTEEAAMLDSLHAISDTGAISAKLRTGGLEASAIPPAATVASFLHECLSLDLDFKLTAGLHHPVRKMDAGLAAPMHGFLNVLIGAAIAHEHDLSKSELTNIIEETDPAAFSHSDDDVSWQDLEAGWETIQSVRDLFVGFGSCSVSEPVEDLAALGISIKE